MIRRILICLAFATWCFLNCWVRFAEGHVVYYAYFDPLYAVAFPVACCELLIACALFAAWEYHRRHPLVRPALAHAAFLLACFVPIGVASVAALAVSPIDLVPVIRKPYFWPVVFVAASAPLILAFRRPRTVSRMVQGLFLYSWPVLAIVFVQAWRATLHFPQRAYETKTFAARLPERVGTVRVIWIIFDELSQQIVFGGRPAGLDLPNFDRLRSDSFYASAATAPGAATDISMPALTLGTLVAGVTPNGPGDLLIKAEDSAVFSWSSRRTVFDDARDLGYNTAIVGWYHPYALMFNRSLTECFWVAGWLLSGVEEPFERTSLPSEITERVKLQAAALPLVGHVPGFFPAVFHHEEKIRRFEYLEKHARGVVADPSIGLALLHLPVPHPPAIYNRASGNFSPRGPLGYLDSVALADRTLGELRAEVEKAGLSSRTVFLVSADHGWRTGLWRGTAEWTQEEESASHVDTSSVPFLIKLPNQESRFTYEKPLNTVITRALIGALLRGSIRDAAEVAQWIEAHPRVARVRPNSPRH